MSTTIDERVVEMRFDNSRFERNVATTMSTLDKLKQKLNLTGASKGLENIDASAKKVNMSGLGTAVEAVSAKFSAMQVVGVTALANITNSAINAGKRMVSALTIDPVKTGFQEYETQMNAIQTIYSNTKGKGSTLDDVNNALKTLNEYADQTIYNFTEMTRNIGTFTAAGVDLQTSVDSIKGIANLAAVSGSSSQQASTAMYQLSQALAAGKVSLMDWNSVVNAGMGGELFQNALIRTSELLKTGAKDAINTYGSFRESLTQGEWLTTEVLTETLKQLSGAYSEADLIAQGFTKEQAKEISELGTDAVEAATKVKTFTQLWDVMKEATQSGWAETWKIIIGDFDEAKNLFSPISEFLTGENGIITKFSEARNKLLEGALGKGLGNLADKVSSVMKPLAGTAEAVKTVTDTVKDYSKVVDEILGGSWGDGQARWDKLTKSGYDWAHAQNLVNEKLGDGTRHTTKYKEAQDDLSKSQNKSAETQTELSKSDAKRIEQLTQLSDEQLKSKGYTDEQIQAFKELKATADNLGLSVSDLILNMDEINGRWLLIDSLKNVGKGLLAVFKSLGEAWESVFPPMTSDQLFNIIAGMHRLSQHFVVGDETAKNLTRTFKGLFSLVGIVTDIIGGGFKIAIKAVSAILGYFDLDILEATALLGDAIVKFREMTNISKLFEKGLDIIVPLLGKAAKAIKTWAGELSKMPAVEKAISAITNAFSKLKDLDLKEIGKNIIEGLKKGLGDGVGDIIDNISKIAKNIISKFCEILGIHSPSVVMMAIGGFIVAGLTLGILKAFPELSDSLQTIKEKITEFMGNIDWGALFAIGMSAGMVFFIKKIADVFKALSGPVDAVTDILENCSDVVKNASKVVKSFSGVLKSFSLNIKAKALKNIAIAIAILAGSLVVLAFVPADKLKTAGNAIGQLAVVMIGLMLATEKMSKASTGIEGLKAGLLAISAAMLILAVTVKILGSMDQDEAKQGFAGLAGLVLGIASVFMAFGAITKFGGSAEHIDKAGKMITKMSIALLLMVGAAKLISTMSGSDMRKAAVGIGGFVAVVALLMTISMIPGKNVDKVGSMLMKISGAMLIMVGVARLIAGMSWEDMGKAAVGIGGLIAVIALLMTISMIPGGNVDKVGSMLLKISGAMLILTVTARIISGMSWGDMGKAAVGLLGLTGIIALLVSITKIAGNNGPKIAGTLLAISLSIGILAAVAMMLSLMKVEGLVKGITAIGMLSLFMMGLIQATKGAQDCKSNLIVMTVAIAVMAASVAALSLIDGSKLAGATIALSTLMGMFALIEKMGGNMQKCVGNLVVMTLAVGMLAFVLYKLSGLPVESTLATAASLSMLLLSLSVAMGVLKMSSSISPMAIIAIGVLTLVVAALGSVLTTMQDLPIESTINNAISLSTLLIAMSAACAILTVVGLGGPAAIIGVLSLIAIIGVMGGLVVAIGTLVKAFPQLEEFLNTGIPIIEKIGHALGSFFGNVVAGFAEGATSGLPEMANNLSAFMTKLQPFIEGAKSIDSTALLGVASLAAMIALVTAANVIDSIASFLTGESSMAKFAAQLSLFGDAIVAFSNKVKGNIDESSVMAAANAGKILAEMQSNIVGTGGVFQFFAGEKNMADFGAQILAFGNAIVGFSNTVKGNVDEEAVTAAANAGTLMTELQSKVAPTGGVLQFFTGDKNMAEFGSQLVAFGSAIVAFSNKVKEGVDEAAITAAANAGIIMTTLQDKIQATGGVFQIYTGQKNMVLFGTQLVAFGEAIVEFSNTVKGNIDESAITAAANAGSIMTTLQDKLPNTGGIFQLFAGQQDLSTFAKDIVKFGKAITEFSDEVDGNIDEGAVTAAANAGRIMAELQKAIPEDTWFDGKQSLGDFGKDLKKFGKHIAGYYEEISGVNAESLSSTTTGIKKVVNVIKNLGDIDTSGVKSFKKAVDELAKVNLKDVAKAFNDTSKFNNVGVKMVESIAKGVTSKKGHIPKIAIEIANSTIKAFQSKQGTFNKVGAVLITAFAKGMISKKAIIKAATTSSIASALTSIRGYYDNFYNAGSYLVSGFAAGISENAYKAAAKAKAMAAAAEKAAKEELDINSPSKVFRKIGSSVPEGFAMGIEMYGRVIKGSTSVMANTAIDSFKDSIARIADVINSDIESQPTIRPVLDLSDVSSGVGAMNGMFNLNPSVGVMANLNAISASMSTRQNGSNDDVVSAISDLKKSLNNRPGDTISINGITYDDGSNIADAVRTIARAVRIERRV